MANPSLFDFIVDAIDIIQRIGASLLAGFLLGLERESRGRAAGLRTTILVCMAATLAMILSDLYYVSHAETEGWRPDPGRLGAGILTGMGFIGAGVIVRQGQMVQGVTTAALLWFITVIGFCFGSGQMMLGAVGFSVAALVLYGLRHIEALVQSEQIFVLSITAVAPAKEPAAVTADLKTQGLSPRLTELSFDKSTGAYTLILSVKFKRRHDPPPHVFVESLAKSPGMLQVSLR